MKDHKFLSEAARYLLLTLGCFLYSTAVAVFLDPYDLAPGGVVGTAIMISYLTNIPTGTLTLAINIPLLIVGVRKFGRDFLLYTVYSTVVSSLMINWLSRYSVNTDDKLLCGIVGGALMALGMGIVFKNGGTTGGTDIIVKLFRTKLRHIKTNLLFAISDSIVVSASALVFNDVETALYAGISVTVSMVVMDLVLYGPDEAKAAFIISDKAGNIAKRMLDELSIGVTFLSGSGAYTSDRKQVIMCATHKRTFPEVRTVVKEEDPTAFMIIMSATEVFGEGFKEHLDAEL